MIYLNNGRSSDEYINTRRHELFNRITTAGQKRAAASPHSSEAAVERFMAGAGSTVMPQGPDGNVINIDMLASFLMDWALLMEYHTRPEQPAMPEF